MISRIVQRWSIKWNCNRSELDSSIYKALNLFSAIALNFSL